MRPSRSSPGRMRLHTFAARGGRSATPALGCLRGYARYGVAARRLLIEPHNEVGSLSESARGWQDLASRRTRMGAALQAGEAMGLESRSHRSHHAP
jgi:hypothetical protein